eukprot:gb/GECH01009455.1/.p1 GENE.gb/GECH01009455.1/~~gb/GECH01009455.1/.p1  ORF type:complete len:165 (+),score=30.97 gb/GECH01009455.1/:1-495(+)
MGGFYTWNSNGCNNYDGSDDSLCGCCVRTIPGLKKIPPEAPQNLAAGNGTNVITWEASYLGKPDPEYEIVCTDVNDAQNQVITSANPKDQSATVTVSSSGEYECYIKADNGVGQPLESDSITIELVFEPTMTLASNGVTVLCSGLENGAVGEVNDTVYIKRDRD